MLSNTPNVIHFIYPVTEKTRPWSYINHLTLCLARKIHNPDKIIVWTNAPAPSLELRVSVAEAGATIERAKLPLIYEGICVEWPQYMSDIMRLQILKEYGGIYMDTDMLLLQPLSQHMSDRLVLSWENAGQTSISNALMMSPPENDFIAEWLDRMPGALKSDTWAYGGVVLPGLLAKAQELEPTRTILPYTFCCPLDLSQQWLISSDLADQAEEMSKNSTGIHVWETFWRAQLKRIGWDYPGTEDNLLSRIINRHYRGA